MRKNVFKLKLIKDSKTNDLYYYDVKVKKSLTFDETLQVMNFHTGYLQAFNLLIDLFGMPALKRNDVPIIRIITNNILLGFIYNELSGNNPNYDNIKNIVNELSENNESFKPLKEKIFKTSDIDVLRREFANFCKDYFIDYLYRNEHIVMK